MIKNTLYKQVPAMNTVLKKYQNYEYLKKKHSRPVILSLSFSRSYFF